jgi:hypothetical protein
VTQVEAKRIRTKEDRYMHKMIAKEFLRGEFHWYSMNCYMYGVLKMELRLVLLKISSMLLTYEAI